MTKRRQAQVSNGHDEAPQPKRRNGQRGPDKRVDQSIFHKPAEDDLDWVPADLRKDKEILRSMLQLYLMARSMFKVLTDMDRQNLVTYGRNLKRQKVLREMSNEAQAQGDSKLYLALSRQAEGAVVTASRIVRDLRLDRTSQGQIRKPRGGGGTLGSGTDNEEWKGLL